MSIRRGGVLEPFNRGLALSLRFSTKSERGSEIRNSLPCPNPALRADAAAVQLD